MRDAQTEANKAQHSPLPWSADKWATGYTVSATDHSVCHLQDCNNDEANAKLIVRAVNHADKLAEALRDCIVALNRLQGQSIEYPTAIILSDAANNAGKQLATYEAAQ